LALCILRLWIVPLPSSFWVDETGTLFVVRQGAHHPSLNVAPQVPASIYFWLPRAVDPVLTFLPHTAGVMETVYRLPSILAMALALFVIAQIAQRLIHPNAGWFAVFACLALRGIDYEAADARPYALGIVVVSATTLFLIRWLDHGRILDAVAFVVLAALIWRVHRRFWPFYLVLLVYALTRPTRNVLIAFAVIAVSLIPVLFEAMALSHHAAEHVMAPVPPPTELLRELKFGLLFVCAALACAFRPRALRKISPSPLALILAWWLIPPIALYAFSWATGNSVFVHRYLSFALPGAALAGTAAAAFLLPEPRWNWAAIVLGLGVFIFLGDWRIPWPPHHNSDWRAAAAAINALPNASTLSVICPSPFVEARSPAWHPEYALPGFLYAHLAAYPVQGKLLLFPFQSSPEVERWAFTLHPGRQFVIYGQAPIVEFWRGWYLKQGRTFQTLGDFGDVSAVLISSPNP